MKCTTCHNVSSQGITGGKVKDLAGVGSRHSKSWIVAFLQKKEMLDGKPHKKTWAGTDEELDVLATWLAALK
jgi:hypothetical protein